ncbi:L-aspartate oxidase [Oleidesulfovibrio alaskensis G20]|jgi:L-aspartate oxidase|uniref:L-aspartate oxidase n=1 Tax=Oleidesulfovibrio alaskensis (strain ATCC BAA-1058 / DSM 17464 / G20) TaxID=207559 RepID=Q310M0_OLEA2|nr:L-aspartate oxidase [Oleidesulfovibrio alaskensis]ABB38626.1 L-aspartate oxidase [Oleidesulfovibrio alaskensis G20]MBG0773892.1 L-aspartate oxidase [Oleidesulfovibrio alaskensis]
MSTFRPVTPVLVIGSGIAGCTAALTLADMGIEVTLITSGDTLDKGNTALAQGGIVFRAHDGDPKQLEKDILVAGHRYNSTKAVRHVSVEGPKAVQDVLVDRLSIPFARQQDDSKTGADCEWDMTMEGGHAAQRILHCADYTGRAIMDGLMREVQASPNIRVLTNRTAIDLLTSHHHGTSLEFKYQLVNQCAGAYVFNEQLRCVETILADFTVLATGGIGQIYLHTTNSPVCVGSGLAMAYRAGGRIENAEFVQFHPTALYHRTERRFLITEAMRGEGARLVNASGEPFMHRYDPRADLAPRDIVARAIVEEMLSTGSDCVFLDAANYVEHNLETRFPTIFQRCLNLGIDIRRQPIPVVPAAHYFCGGVLADLNGRTTLERLYSVGECNCTGVHGANRLASTSLLEALLWGRNAALNIHGRLGRRAALNKRLRDSIPDWNPLGDEKNDDPALIAQDWTTLRNTMWNYVGITRTSSRLQRAHDEMRDLWRHVSDFYKRTPLSKPLVDLFHGCQAGYVVTMAARRNKQSVGCHYRID